MATLALPILDAPVLRDAVPRDLGVDCGMSRTLTLRRYHLRRLQRMVPAHTWQLASAYGIRPEPGETHDDFARGEQ